MLARLGVEIQQIAYSDAGGRVSLSFNHACAAIQFKIGQSKTLAYKSVTFNSITLVDVYKSGKSCMARTIGQCILYIGGCNEY